MKTDIIHDVGIIVLFIIFSVFFTGCANVTTSRFVYKGVGGDSLMVEMPKEVEADDLKVFLDAQKGTAQIEAKKWKSHMNVPAIIAQGDREAAISNGVVKSAVEGAVKGLVPVP